MVCCGCMAGYGTSLIEFDCGGLFRGKKYVNKSGGEARKGGGGAGDDGEWDDGCTSHLGALQSFYGAREHDVLAGWLELKLGTLRQLQSVVAVSHQSLAPVESLVLRTKTYHYHYHRVIAFKLGASDGDLGAIAEDNRLAAAATWRPEVPVDVLNHVSRHGTRQVEDSVDVGTADDVFGWLQCVHVAVALTLCCPCDN